MSGVANTVLLLTHRADHFTIDRVVAEVQSRGGRAVRLNTDLFPRRIELTSLQSTTGHACVATIDDQRVDLEDISGVWLRRIWPADLGDELDPAFVDNCRAESQAALMGFLDGLHAASWVDPPAVVHECENKLRQLRLARSAGLTIPRTAVTNGAEQAREFFDECDGDVVAKLLRPLSSDMGAPERFVYTSVVAREDLDEAESLRYSPMVFQQRVEIGAELRVAFVDGACFAGEIRLDPGLAQAPDWRRPSGLGQWSRGALPDEVIDQVRVLMASLGLTYGAIDFIRTPAGEHVFLEVNPSGEWGMLERELDLPIANAIAAALLGERQ